GECEQPRLEWRQDSLHLKPVSRHRPQRSGRTQPRLELAVRRTAAGRISQRTVRLQVAEVLMASPPEGSFQRLHSNSRAGPTDDWTLPHRQAQIPGPDPGQIP